MNKTTLISIGVVPTILAVGYWWLASPKDAPGVATQNLGPADSSLILGQGPGNSAKPDACPWGLPGSTQIFSGHWLNEQHVDLGALSLGEKAAGQATTRVFSEWRGEIELACVGASVAEVRIKKSTHLVLRVNGKEAPAVDLLGAWARIEIADDGAFESVDTYGTPVAARNFLATLVPELQVSAHAQVINNRRGALEVRLERGEKTQATTIEQTLVRYRSFAGIAQGKSLAQSIKGVRSWRFHDGGNMYNGSKKLNVHGSHGNHNAGLQHAMLTETLILKQPNGTEVLNFEQSIQLDYVSTQTMRVATNVPLTPSTAHDTGIKHDDVNALPITQVLATLRTNLNKLPNRGRFIWGAIQRLKAEPQLSDQVAQSALRPDATYAQEQMALDILVHSGSDQAQKALRDVLEKLPSDNLPEYAPLFQRLSFLEKPNTESVDFVAARVRGEDGVDAELRRSAVFTYGALAKHLKTMGENERADQLVTELDGLLAAATNPEDIRAGLGGLGNAAMARSESTILGYTTHEAAMVRAQAASALRTYTSETVGMRLVDMSGDAGAFVQQSALRSLQGRTLSQAHRMALANNIEAKQLKRVNLPLMVNVISTYSGTEAGRRALEAAFTQSPDDADLRGRIRALLLR